MPDPATRTVRVTVMLRHGVLDPQGQAIARALGSMGFAGVAAARQGKVIELDVGPDVTDADVAAMCEGLLANPVIERFEIAP